MKKITLALASFLVAGVASAADLPRKSGGMVAPVAAPVGMNWTGFYAGLQAGYGSTKAAYTIGGVGYTQPESGFFGGLRVGYDWQMNNFVVGLYGDLNLSGVKSTSYGVAAAGDVSVAKLKLPGDINLRAGYLLSNNFLVYALAGYGFASQKVDYTVAGVTQSATSSINGYNLGLGAEYRMARNWSVFGEYSYTRFSSSVNYNKGTVGVNYRF